uniref:Tetratricopeptide repeat protein SKI3 n=1 Tax=Kalanchoe fedtschenkoi TaxID=63787 RepID=A0A7N0T3Q5_KALFE
MEEKLNEIRLLQTDSDDHSHHFNLGLSFWDKGEEVWRVKAAEHFLISAKLNPRNGAAFRYLGQFYENQSTDRAVKCYQRAVTLDPNDSESGEALCNLLDKGGKFGLEIAVCVEASNSSPRAFWATRILGYFQVHQRKWSEAVQSLQHAIRGYPTCADLWESLGFAYQSLGMFTAALKSYGRAIDLDKSRVFALVESGNTHLMLGFFRKGVEQFRRALEISPQNISAHYGLASALFGLAKECNSLGAFGWASSLLEEATNLEMSSKFFTENKSSLWKLHGDLLFTLAKCFPWKKGDNFPHNRDTFNASILAWKQNCYSAAISARRSYQKALHLTPWQPNIYCDIGLASDLICGLGEHCDPDPEAWQLSEKMPLGGLLLDACNCELWVALGCLSHHNALVQHAYIRGLQLDVSLATAWAYLGKLYRKECKRKMTQKAFDSARSIDPSLALPWAGMAADSCYRKTTIDEAFEDCLRSVQIFPQADFQIGLVKIALMSNHLSSAQVFAASQQVVQCAPQNPESHNLNGLVLEARENYSLAAASFRLARFALQPCDENLFKLHIRDISINLARSLCKAGNAVEAVCECEYLNKEGLLDVKGFQIYALSLYRLGQNNLALSLSRTLSSKVSSMTGASSPVFTNFIISLLHEASGLDSSISAILKMPEELFESSEVSFPISAIHALDRNKKLTSLVVKSRRFVESHEDVTEMHYLIALTKLLRHGSERCLNFQSGVEHLRKALHSYPSSLLLRNLLGYLLSFGKEGQDLCHATKCCIMDIPPHSEEGLKLGCEVLGAGSIACYNAGNRIPEISFPSCNCRSHNAQKVPQQLQKLLHQEPWNIEVHYLVALNFLQKAREEGFPSNLCGSLKRFILPLFYEQIDSTSGHLYQYQKFQLLLCASEIDLQNGDDVSSEVHALTASALMLPDGYLFFAHLMLCRIYHVREDSLNLEQELVKCLQLKTHCHIGWICFFLIENGKQSGTRFDRLGLCQEECFKRNGSSGNIWMSVYNFVLGLLSLRKQNILCAREFLAKSCSLAEGDSCIFLCHGAICLELARKKSDSQYILLAVKNLTRAQELSTYHLPFVSILLAQAVGSLGSVAKWESNLRLEWDAWRAGNRPAELSFQMHLLVKSLEKRGTDSCSSDSCQAAMRWAIRSIHLNPASSRYWKVLQRLLE